MPLLQSIFTVCYFELVFLRGKASIMHRIIVQAISTVIVLFIFGCGVSESTLKNAEQRIAALRQKGVPDSVLSPATVYLYQLRGFEAISAQDKDIPAAMKHLTIALSNAENFHRYQVAALKPSLDSLRQKIRNAQPNYTGLQRKKFDSLASIADSFNAIGWLLQAHSCASSLAGAIPGYNAAALRSKELADSVPGNWECINTQSSPESKPINTRDRKLFSFGNDGSVKLTESRKGQSGNFLKEDWEFISTGKWELCGDTIHLLIDRFGSNRRHFEELVSDSTGKQSWKKRDEPAFDSAIADGSQNRFIAYADLKADFKKK